MICLCEKEINIDKMINLLDESQIEMKEAAKKRLENYASHYCMSCCDRFIKDGDEIKKQTTNIEYQKIAVLFGETEKNLDNDMANVAHILCKKCVKKIGKKDYIPKSKLKGPGAEITIKHNYKNMCCNICLNDHYVKTEDLKKVNKNLKCGGGCF